jgi:hypothetical protein
MIFIYTRVRAARAFLLVSQVLSEEKDFFDVAFRMKK